MKFVAISDIHRDWSMLQNLPEGDVFIFAGDFSNWGEFIDIQHCAMAMANLPFKHKLLIAGNHDMKCEGNYAMVKETFAQRNIRYCENELVEIDGIKIYLSPYATKVGFWKFGVMDGQESKDMWARIPDDIDILVTHGPPFGVLDNPVERYGNRQLLTRVTEIQPEFHIFGHIHEEGGRQYYIGRTTFANVCMEPYVFEVNK